MEPIEVEEEGKGDYLWFEPFVFNPCWDVTRMFKTPLKSPAIPLPDSLIIYIEKRFPEYLNLNIIFIFSYAEIMR